MTHTPVGDAQTPSPLQGIAPPLKIPLSVGAALRRSPSSHITINSNDMVVRDGDLLLGPEDLAISSPPPHQPMTLSDLSAISRDDRRHSTRDAEINRQEDLAVEPITVEDDEDAGNASTWVGVPIPQDMLNPPSDSPIRRDQPQRATSALRMDRPAPPRSSDREVVDVVASPQSRGATEQGTPVPTQGDQNLWRPGNQTLAGAPMVTMKAPNDLKARYSNHLERQHKHQSSTPAHEEASQSVGIQDSGQHAPQPVQEVLRNDQRHSSAPPMPTEAEDLASTHSIFPPQSSPPSHREAPRSRGEVSDSEPRGDEGLRDGHQMTAELLRYQKRSRFGPLSWVLLILTSIAFGVGIMISIGDEIAPLVTVDAQVQSVKYDLDSYQMLVQLSSSVTAQLLVPDDWIAEENSDQFIPIKGQREVILRLPTELLKLGDNVLHAQWLFEKSQDEPVPPRPAQIDVTLDWKLKEIKASPERDEFEVIIQTLAGAKVLKSDVPHTLDGTGELHSFQVSREQIKTRSEGGYLTTINFTMSRPSSSEGASEHPYQATFLLPHTPVPLSLNAPVRRYARPEAHVMISGRSAPRAQVRLVGLRLEGSESSSALPSSQTLANDQGYFTLKVPLSHLDGEARVASASTPTSGQVWTVTLEASTTGHLATRTTVTVKRSHKPTWDAYVNGLARRRNQASSRYRSFNQERLAQRPNEWLNKAGKIPGVIAWVDRGVTTQEAEKRGVEARSQGLLIHTCQEGDGCPIWVNDPDAFWVQVGQKVHVFGVSLGVQSHQNAQGETVDLPTLKSRLTTP